MEKIELELTVKARLATIALSQARAVIEGKCVLYILSYFSTRPALVDFVVQEGVDEADADPMFAGILIDLGYAGTDDQIRAALAHMIFIYDDERRSVISKGTRALEEHDVDELRVVCGPRGLSERVTDGSDCAAPVRAGAPGAGPDGTAHMVDVVELAGSLNTSVVDCCWVPRARLAAGARLRGGGMREHGWANIPSPPSNPPSPPSQSPASPSPRVLDKVGSNDARGARLRGSITAASSSSASSTASVLEAIEVAQSVDPE